MAQDPNEEGGWFCRCCGRFTNINQDREMMVCAKCGRPGLKWCEPARHRPPANLPVPAKQGQELFAQLRLEAGLEAA